MKYVRSFVHVGLGMLTGVVGWILISGSQSGLAQHVEPPDLRIDESPLEEELKRTTSFAPVVRRVSPCVVSIQTIQMAPEGDGIMDFDALRRFFAPDAPNPRPREDPFRAQGTGSGVIVSDDGFVLTNHHVIEGAETISVTLADGKTILKAKVLGADKHSDLAVLKVEAKGLPAMTLGDSRQLEVGDVVLALGSPFGLTQSVTMGIVSATGRSSIGMMDIENFIQTDASINPGNSGRALVDVQGRLVGINTMIMSRSGGNQGIGFAIPVNMARGVMDQLIRFGDVQRGLLGVAMQEMDGVLAKQFGLEKPQGVLVGDVTPGGPAEQAGVEPGDVILRYASREIADMNALRLMVVETRPGEEVVIELIRGSKKLELTVTIGLLPEQGYSGLNRYVPPKTLKPELETLDKLPGVELGALDASTRQRYQIADSVEGLVILSLDTSGFAFEQGLREGQVIMDINREPVRNLSDLAEFQKLKPGESWLLRLWSEGGARFLVLEHP